MSFTVASLGMLTLMSCSSTPASRIKESPQVFNALPTQQKQLVSQGRIEQGMTPPAVYLAWGDPSRVAEGVINGQQAMRWIYSTLQPVYSPPPTFWGGPFWGGPGFYPNLYYPYYPYYNDINYVPVNTGHVLFINGKVKSWEKMVN